MDSNNICDISKSLIDSLADVKISEDKLVKQIRDIIRSPQGSDNTKLNRLFELFEDIDSDNSDLTKNIFAPFANLAENDNINIVTKNNIINNISILLKEFTNNVDIITSRSKKVKEILATYDPDTTDYGTVLVRVRQALISM